MLPGMDGFSVLRELRKSDRVPVLMLTARDKIEDRVKGLRDGADDYLVKPFALSELLARVLALGRRSGQNQGEAGGQNVLRVGDLELDLLRRRASRGGVRLNLTAKEFTLLALLMRKQVRCCRGWSWPSRYGTSISTATPMWSRSRCDDCAARSTTL